MFPTGLKFYVFHAVVLCGWGCLMAYCVYNGDVNRIIRGYDSYGNICGLQNIVRDDTKISDNEGFDMRMRPYLLVFKPDQYNNYTYKATYAGLWIIDTAVPEKLSTIIARVCLANCRTYPNHVRFKKRCILKIRKGVSNRIFGATGIPNLFMEVTEDLYLCWKYYCYIGLGSSALSFVVMVLLSIFTRAMVWLVLIATVLLSFVFTTYMLILFIESKQTIDQSESLASTIQLERNKTYIAFAIIGTLIMVYLITILLCNRKKMKLVIQLYQEAIKHVTAMRLLLLQPLLTCLCVSATISVWMYAILWIESSGYKIEFSNEFLMFEKDSWNFLARWYNIFVLLWMINFLLDCQHMIVARAVSLWYFCKQNNHKLEMPISYGFYDLVIHHLGLVSLGSLLTLLTAIPKIILKIIQQIFKTKEETLSDKCCFCYLQWSDSILKYFTRDAYIEIVIYGYPFRRAGRQAFSALNGNDLHIASVKHVGNFVLHFACLLVCIASMQAGVVILQNEEGLLHLWVVLILTGILAYLISTSFFSLYQSIIDTMFLCFCEDYNNHDGISKPYYVSKQFLELVVDLHNSLQNNAKTEF